jgi:hypothetical protein
MNKQLGYFFVCLIALSAVPALAGPLATDGTAISGWHGSTPYQGYDAGNNPTGLVGYIDWAVYAPGHAPAGFTPDVGNGYTGATSGEYLYTYQAYETGSANLSFVSVAMTGPADNIGDFTATGISGQAPVFDQLVPNDSASWYFNGVGPGASSFGLSFSSPNGPTWSAATTIDDGSIASGMPVPASGTGNIPEPSTLVLAICGFVGLAFQVLRRHVKKATM